MWFAGLVAGLLIGWLFLPTPPATCGAYQAESMPAWVQAIGSVAAIFVAAGIPFWRQRREKNEEGKRLSIATLRLRSRLEALGRAAGERAAELREFKVEGSTPDQVSQLIHQMSLQEIRPIEDYIDRVHHLDDRIQKPVLSLMKQHDQFDVDLGRIYGTREQGRVAELLRCHTTMIDRIEEVGLLAFTASNAIQLIEEEKRFPDLKARNFGGRS